MGCVHHPVGLTSAPYGTLCRFSTSSEAPSVTVACGVPLLESKAVIPSSNISLDYSDLAKVLTLIGALTSYSWVCFKQAKATNLN